MLYGASSIGKPNLELYPASLDQNFALVGHIFLDHRRFPSCPPAEVLGTFDSLLPLLILDDRLPSLADGAANVVMWSFFLERLSVFLNDPLTGLSWLSPNFDVMHYI